MQFENVAVILIFIVIGQLLFLIKLIKKFKKLESKKYIVNIYVTHMYNIS